MSTLTQLSALHGFGELTEVDTDGYVAVIPGYQSIWFADGRDYDSKGYHKLVFHTTKVVGTADAALYKGEAVVQTTSGAAGVYDECTDVKISGTLTTASVPFQLGEKVTQAVTLAIGYVVYVGSGFINVCPVSRNASTGAAIAFTATANALTGATSGAVYSSPSAVTAAGLDRFHFIYRTTTTEFDQDNVITGAISGSVITPLTAADGSPDVGACIQNLYPSIAATAGTFTVTYEGQTTAAIAYGATTAAITTAVNLLSTVTAGDIVVSGTTFDSGNATTALVFTFLSTLGSVNPVSITSSMTGAGSVAVTVTTKILQTGFTTVTAPPHWLTWKPTPQWAAGSAPATPTVTNAGIMPDGGSNIGVLCFGRIFLNSMSNPHQWFCTRINYPLDFDSSQTDVAAATSSQNTPKAGLVGSPIVAMVSYKDHYLVFGCSSEVYIMRSDPVMGGVNTPVSKETGFFSPTSWCWDDQNNLYFMGIDGIYRLSSDAIVNASPPENITKERVPKLISSIGLNRRTDRVAMAYDKQRYGIEVSVTQKDGAWSTVFWIDLRTGGLFPDSFPTDQSPASMMYFDSYKTSERGLLLGGYDGYIRKFDEDQKDDEGSNAIDSWFTIGPFVDDKDTRNKVSTSETSLTLGEDTDGITVSLYRAESADELVDNVIAGSTPAATKTLTGDGLKSSIRDRVTGRAIAMKYGNNTASQGFSIESINTNLKQYGKEK